MSILPPKKIQMQHLKALNILGAAGAFDKHPYAFLAVRGWYTGMGNKGNDRRIYDDLIALVGSDVYMQISANTDPNGWRPGHGTSEELKGIASLKNGLWLFQKGKHKNRYWAFVQADDFTVLRDADSRVPASKIQMLDGVKVYEDTGEFGIHFHYASDRTTSSLGCQTSPQEEYEPFRDYTYALMDRKKMKTIPYLLIHVDQT